MRTTLILMILLLSVAGCGYKGPLYLPKDKPAAVRKPAPAPPAPVPVPAPAPATEPSATP